MKHRIAPAVALILAALSAQLGGSPAAASEFGINCFGNSNSTALDVVANGAWVLPDDGGAAFRDVHVFPLPPNTGGDLVISAHVIYPQTNLPNARVAYRIQVDGTQQGRVFNYLLPEGFTSAQYVRVVAPNVPTTAAGSVVKLQAKNTTTEVGQPIYFTNIDTYVQAVDSSEATAAAEQAGSISVPGTWTNVLSTTITVGQNKMLLLGGNVRTSGGAVGSRIEYRFLVGSTAMGLQHSAVGNVQPEHSDFSFYHRNPAAGQHTITLQVKGGTASAPMTADQSYLFAQSMPRYPNFWHYESTTPITVNKRTSFQTILPMSNPQQLVWPTTPPANNRLPMYNSGVAYVTLAPQASAALTFRLQQYQRAPGSTIWEEFPFDSGLGKFTPTIVRQKLVGAGQANGCKTCNWNGGSWSHDVELRVKSLCNENSGVITIDRARMQFLMIPRLQTLDLTNFSCNVPLGTPEGGHPQC